MAVTSTTPPGTPTSAPETKPGDRSYHKLRRGRLFREVTRRLERLWSPDEITRRLKVEFPDDPEIPREPRDHLSVALRAGPR